MSDFDPWEFFDWLSKLTENDAIPVWEGKRLIDERLKSLTSAELDLLDAFRKRYLLVDGEGTGWVDVTLIDGARRRGVSSERHHAAMPRFRPVAPTDEP